MTRAFIHGTFIPGVEMIAYTEADVVQMCVFDAFITIGLFRPMTLKLTLTLRTTRPCILVSTISHPERLALALAVTPKACMFYAV